MNDDFDNIVLFLFAIVIGPWLLVALAHYVVWAWTVTA